MRRIRVCRGQSESVAILILSTDSKSADARSILNDEVLNRKGEGVWNSASLFVRLLFPTVWFSTFQFLVVPRSQLQSTFSSHCPRLGRSNDAFDRLLRITYSETPLDWYWWSRESLEHSLIRHRLQMTSEKEIESRVFRCETTYPSNKKTTASKIHRILKIQRKQPWPMVREMNK